MEYLSAAVLQDQRTANDVSFLNLRCELFGSLFINFYLYAVCVVSVVH